MTNWHSVVVLGLSVLIALLFWIPPAGASHQAAFSYKVFKSSVGWGYDILINDSLLIHQETIPAITTKRGFEKAAQAEKAALLVISRLRSGQPPGISSAEAAQICSESTSSNGSK